jgi:hypothetical protein
MAPDRIGPDRIGFDRLIRLRWLDRTALLAAELRDSEALHRAVLSQLNAELSGVKARRNTASVLTRIWWRVPDEHLPLRDEALAQIKACTPEERLMFHWGMCLLAYPLFRDVAATVGRLLRLQGAVRQAQVVSRISAEWGNRLTLETAVPRIVRSFVDWGVLVVTEEKGAYASSPPLTTTQSRSARWLFESVGRSRNTYVPTSDLPHAAELFPFALSLSPGALTNSERLRPRSTESAV